MPAVRPTLQLRRVALLLRWCSSLEQLCRLQDALVAQLRRLFHGLWGAGPLGVPDLLVPGLEVGIDPFRAQDVQVGEIFLREFLLFAGQLTSCSVFIADALGTTWSPRPGIFEIFHRPTVIRAGRSTQFFARSRAALPPGVASVLPTGYGRLHQLSNKPLTQLLNGCYCCTGLLNTWPKLAREPRAGCSKTPVF